MIDVRLIGNVVIAVVCDTKLLSVSDKGGKEGTNEGAVLVGESGGLPAEYPLFLAVNVCDDLGSIFAAPLSEEVGNLKILHSALVRQSYPTVEFFKAEFIAVFGNGNVGKLNGETLAADSGVDGGSEYGGEN